MHPLETADADILTLGMRADDARRAQLGNVATYLRVHDVPPAPVVVEPVPEAAREVRIYTLPATLAEAVAEVRQVRALAPGRRIAAYSFSTLEREAASWGEFAEVLATLARAGLHELAEVPVDQIVDLTGAISLLRDAGLAAGRLTVSHPVEDKRALLNRVRAAVRVHGSVRRFAPLPRVAPIDRPTTGYDDVRTIALSRLEVGDAGSAGPLSIEVDWRLYGPKLAQVALAFGADHLDAVPATSDPALGPRRATVDDVERNIRAAGFEPRELIPAL